MSRAVEGEDPTRSLMRLSKRRSFSLMVRVIEVSELEVVSVIFESYYKL